MADIAACVTLSHSPFYNFVPPEGPGDPGFVFTSAVDRLERSVRQLGLDAVVVFGPDHFRGIFYDCMPAFCVGMERVTGAGDYGTPAGELPTAPALARDIFEGTRARGFDPAFSLHMGVDHGITQAWANLVPSLDVPLVPIMVNTSGPPLPFIRRTFSFGAAVGEAIRRSSFIGRVLVVGSGGLSHWPPKTSAFDPEVASDFRDFLIDGKNRVAEMEPQRQAVVRRMGTTADGRINSDWDHEFLENVRTDLSAVSGYPDDGIEDVAGNGAHEIRAWAAALGAWGAPLVWTGYEAVPRWITGMACGASFRPVEMAVPARSTGEDGGRA
jgi:2,3-dihydroxyphenylpropionate 1,2-dioxygenase